MTDGYRYKTPSPHDALRRRFGEIIFESDPYGSWSISEETDEFACRRTYYRPHLDVRVASNLAARLQCETGYEWTARTGAIEVQIPMYYTRLQRWIYYGFGWLCLLCFAVLVALSLTYVGYLFWKIRNLDVTTLSLPET